jgi:tetratricopeptide (TPR) repeat protein
MVSRNLSLAFVALTLCAQDPNAKAFAPGAKDIPTKPAVAESKPELSPEMRGDIFMARKMYREAVDIYKRAPQDSAVIWNKTGIAYHQMTDLRTARKCYEKSIKLNRQYSEAINNLGTVYYAEKSYRRAISQYKRALAFAPKSASIYSNLGTAHFARKNYNEAVIAYQQALDLDPEVFEHRSTHGVLLQERTVTERARFHYYLAKMYAKAGQNERALLYMQKSLEEGFKEKQKYMEEPEFQALRETEEFKELMAKDLRVL